MASSPSWPARAARESADGQYVLVSDDCALSVAESTVSVVVAGQERALCHLPLASALFGVAGSKLMTCSG